MYYIELFFVVAMGLSFGSFANVGIMRSINDESFGGRSYCRHCGRQLAWLDLIPILSYLFLGGKCRYCKDSISVRYPLVEGICAISWIAIYHYTGLSIAFVLYAGFAFFTLMIGFTDFLTKDVYLWMIVFGCALALLCQVILGQLLFAIHGILIAGGFSLLIYLIGLGIKKIRGYKEAFGFGDILYMAYIGIVLGPLSSLSVITGGAVVMLIAGLLRGKKMGQVMPFCPALAIAAVVNVYLPGGFLGIYLQLIGL